MKKRHQASQSLPTTSPSAPLEVLLRVVRLHQAGHLDQAEILYQKLLAKYPKDPTVLHMLGTIYISRGHLEAGIKLIDEAIVIQPDYALAQCDRGISLAEKLYEDGNLDEAETIYQTLLASYPQNATVLHLLGRLYVHRNDLEAGIKLIDKAITIKPDSTLIYCDRGIALMKLGRYEEALKSYDKAIAIDHPDNAYAKYNKGLIKLLLGEHEEGWKLYEWRWKSANKSETAKLPKKPLWLGDEPLAGKTILLHAEQGFGDTIQLCRYIPQIEAMGATVLLGVPAPLGGLMSGLKASFHLMTEGEHTSEFDLHCPLFSLPLALGTLVNTIPATVPYLFADPHKRRTWQERLGNKVRPRVGLVWSGGPKHKNDHNRSIALKLLSPLWRCNVEFYSLQKEVRPDDITALAQSSILSHAENLHDFTDTAALMSEMDLILSVDTSAAHLAGALGKPVWILLPFVPDFRWMTERDDSPWYPTARLFRQPRIGDWESVIARVASELAATPWDHYQES